MGVPALTIPGLTTEGIEAVDDLSDFVEDDIWIQVSKNLRSPPAPQIPYVLGAKALKRLKIAAIAVSYYQQVDRATTHTNMHYTNVLVDFWDQWVALVKKGEEENEVPRITRTLPIIKWTESFEEFLHQTIGDNNAPMTYIVRADPNVGAPPALLNNKSYSEAHESVEGELIARTSHGTTKFKADNARLFKHIEEAVRETKYDSTIRPFSRKKDGRSAYLALKAQYVGNDKWLRELEKQESFIHNQTWSGDGSFSLESFIMQHRSANVSMTRCSDHVPYQLPNERTRVTHLLSGIRTTNMPLQSAIAHVKSDDGPDGRMQDFESTAAYLSKFDPVQAKRRKTGQSGKKVTIAGVDLKSGVGKSGVELRYHTTDEYYNLKTPQKLELKRWRKTKKDQEKRKTGNQNPTDDGGDNLMSKRQKKINNHVISALSQIQEAMEKQEQEDTATEQQVSATTTSSSTSTTKSSTPSPSTSSKARGSSYLKQIVSRMKSKK